MKIKKFLVISVFLIMILNSVIPTVVLAKQELTTKKENNNVITTENNEKNETENITEKENTESSTNNSSENNTVNELPSNEVNNSKSENIVDNTVEKIESENNAEEIKENSNNTSVEGQEKNEEQIKSRMCIDEPINGSEYYNQDISGIKVKGWKMANVSNTNIKAYINDTEINSEKINYTERPDVIEAVTDYGTEEENPEPGFEFTIDKSDLKDGNNTIRIEVYSKDNQIITSENVEINFVKGLHIEYRTHVQDYGWQGYVKDGEISGTTNESKRLEAINIQLVNSTDENLKIKYQVHIQEKGWQEWKENGEMAGTEGEGLRLEAIKIELENSEEYSIEYRVHIEEDGWQDWKTDGELAGTTGEGKRLEAIEIRIVEKHKKARMCIDEPINGSEYYNQDISGIKVKGWKMANVSNTNIKAYINDTEINSEKINYTERPDVIEAVTDYGTEEENPEPGFEFTIDKSDLKDGNNTIRIEVYSKDNQIITSDSVVVFMDTQLHIKYSAHVEEIGWQEYVQDGELAGTTGQNLEIEALKLELINAPDTAHIKYKSYVEGEGWSEYVQDGEQIGTTGQNKKIQAIQIDLEGLDGYVVEYRTHVEEIGWQSWASNGMEVGTTKQTLGIEAINIRIVEEKNTVVPSVTYSVHNSINGWTAYGRNGIIVGDTTSGVKLDDIKIALENSGQANIKYSVHLQELNWQDEVENNQQAGVSNSENGIEAIKITLEGLEGYSVQYRTYVIGRGWQDWVEDGEISGTTGESLQIGAIQIRIIIKVDFVTKSNFESLNESKYPGYKEALRKLQEQHPNWIITIDYTGLDWNTVLDNEDVLVTGKDGAVSARSLTQYTDQWRNGDPTQYESGWYRASRAAIAYMMDPRNSFDDEYVFQFQELASSQGTYSEIAMMIEGTFLTKYSGVSNTDSVIKAILNSAQMYNISPYHLVSRMLQEQGRDGGSLNGYSYGGRTVYNLFNIGASNSATASSIENGAAYAYNHHWFTPETCIKGSAEFLARDYISIGQSTLYYQKYDVVGDELYTHQYMTNIRAANDEGQRMGKDYKENGLIDLPFEFTIPVYENMPSEPSPRPSGTTPW